MKWINPREKLPEIDQLIWCLFICCSIKEGKITHWAYINEIPIEIDK